MTILLLSLVAYLNSAFPSSMKKKTTKQDNDYAICLKINKSFAEFLSLNRTYAILLFSEGVMQE
jgi:hypothetical protein